VTALGFDDSDRAAVGLRLVDCAVVRNRTKLTFIMMAFFNLVGILSLLLGRVRKETIRPLTGTTEFAGLGLESPPLLLFRSVSTSPL
jgi:hypothetical protein